MLIRPRQILKIIGPALILAILFLAFYYARAMQGRLFNYVTFEKSAAWLPTVDRQAIQTVTLHDAKIAKHPTPFTRYKIVFDHSSFVTNSKQSPLITGHAYSNDPRQGDGVVVVQKKDGQWRVAAVAVDAFAAIE